MKKDSTTFYIPAGNNSAMFAARSQRNTEARLEGLFI